MNIFVASLVASRDQKPLIDIHIEGHNPVQLDAEAALKIGMDIIHCAFGSYIDSFLVNFLMEKVFKDKKEESLQRSTMILEEFREFREKLELEFKKSQKEI